MRHVWAMLNYSQLTFDSGPLKPLMSEACDGCNGALDFFAEMKKRHAKITGGLVSISRLRVEQLAVKNIRPMAVAFDETTTREVITYRGGNKEVYPGGVARDRFVLFPEPDGWLLTKWEAIS